MAKGTYTILSEEGIERLQTYGVQQGAKTGDEVELDFTAAQKKAVVAAGWVEFHDPDAVQDPDAKDAPDTKGGKK